jgi:hypothetical protein
MRTFCKYAVAVVVMASVGIELGLVGADAARAKQQRNRPARKHQKPRMEFNLTEKNFGGPGELVVQGRLIVRDEGVAKPHLPDKPIRLCLHVKDLAGNVLVDNMPLADMVVDHVGSGDWHMDVGSPAIPFQPGTYSVSINAVLIGKFQPDPDNPERIVPTVLAGQMAPMVVR